MSETNLTILFEKIRKNWGLTYKRMSIDLGYSLTYIFDIAKGNKIPTKEIAEKIIKVYRLTPKSKRLLYDAIAEASNNLPYNVIDFLKQNPEEINRIMKPWVAKKRYK